ncbi:MFS transporter [Defluviimonas sp. WL0002]|uniref:MFS transporter n=1 Tax=Albidovulum marisflavi TaxID=2984159 RepID=A0ABT2ZEZ7_9RHOB|nr:MFS transporter [Defluviimonas sp. WL0002]MCV2869713.1 MFS transporter [Defluviimonas sp. WL0002]
MSLLVQIRLARAPLVAFGAMGMLWGAFAALVPDIKAMLGASDAQYGTLLFATPLAAVAAMLMAPRIAPRLGSNVLPVSMLALALSFFLPGWMTVPLFFAIAMMAVGASNGFLDVAMNARVSALEIAHGLHLMNINHAAYSFGYAASAVATGVARAAGHAPGEILGAVAVTIGVLGLLTYERGPDINGFGRSTGLSGRLGMLPVWGGLIVLIAFLAENAAENWSALHIERTLGGSVQEGSFGPAVMALTAGLGRTVGQVVVAKVAETRLMRWGVVVAALGMVVTALAPSPQAVHLGLIVTGLGTSVIAPTAFSVVGRLSDPGRRALMIARATTLGYLGYFFGPPALGLVAELFGLRAAFLGISGVILVVLLLFPRLLACGAQTPAPGKPPLGVA